MFLRRTYSDSKPTLHKKGGKLQRKSLQDPHAKSSRRKQTLNTQYVNEASIADCLSLQSLQVHCSQATKCPSFQWSLPPKRTSNGLQKDFTRLASKALPVAGSPTGSHGDHSPVGHESVCLLKSVQNAKLHLNHGGPLSCTAQQSARDAPVSAAAGTPNAPRHAQPPKHWSPSNAPTGTPSCSRPKSSISASSTPEHP